MIHVDSPCAIKNRAFWCRRIWLCICFFRSFSGRTDRRGAKGAPVGTDFPPRREGSYIPHFYYYPHSKFFKNRGIIMASLIYLAPVLGIVALLFAFVLAGKVNKMDEGTDRMQEIAASIREGARAFLSAEYNSGYLRSCTVYSDWLRRKLAYSNLLRCWCNLLHTGRLLRYDSCNKCKRKNCKRS